MRMIGEKRWGLMIAIGLALAVASVGLFACGGDQAAQSDDSGKLDIGIAFPEDDWRTAFIQDFAKEVEERSRGAIETQIHYMDEYKDMQDLLKEMSHDTGKLDIVLSANAYLGDYSYPELYVSGLPYLFESFEDAWEFAESDVNAQIEAGLPQYGMRILAHYCGGFRNLGASRPIDEPGDLKGLVVATVKSPIMMDMLFMLGANPQASVAGELHDALAKGVYTGVEVSLPTFFRDADYDYLPYVAVTNHSYNMWSLIIDEDVWQSLSPENQKIVKDAAGKYARLERMESKKRNDEIIASLQEAGVIITYPDYESFKVMTEDVRKRHSAAYSETYEEVKQYLDSQRSGESAG